MENFNYLKPYNLQLQKTVDSYLTQKQRNSLLMNLICNKVMSTELVEWCTKLSLCAEFREGSNRIESYLCGLCISARGCS